MSGTANRSTRAQQAKAAQWQAQAQTNADVTLRLRDYGGAIEANTEHVKRQAETNADTTLKLAEIAKALTSHATAIQQTAALVSLMVVALYHPERKQRRIARKSLRGMKRDADSQA